MEMCKECISSCVSHSVQTQRVTQRQNPPSHQAHQPKTPAYFAMARSGAASLLVVCVLAAIGMCAVSFVGSPGAATRAPAVAMNFFGESAPATTTPPPAASIVEDPSTYILGISALMIVSVVANSGGFFGPWSK